MSEVHQTAALDELVELRPEKIVSGKDPKLPYIGLEHIAQGQPRLLSHLPSNASTGVNCRFAKDDILFGKLRPNLRKSLRMPFPGYCSTDILVLRARQGVHPHFAAHVLQWERVFSHASATAAGTKMPRTSWEELRRFRVFRPLSEQEQTRIAAVLDTVDEAIAKTEAVIGKLRQVRAGLLHDLLTRGLDAHGQLRPTPNEAPHLYQASPLGPIPKEWEIKRFSETVEEATLGTTVRGKSGGNRTIPLLKMGNLLWGELCLREVEEVDADRVPNLDKLRLQHRDFLFNTRNSPELVGKTAIWRNELAEATHDNNLLRVRFKSCVVSPFACLWMSNGIGKNLVFSLATATTSAAAIYWRNLAGYPLPVPSPEEQEGIVAKVEAQDGLIAQESMSLSKLHQLKSGLMTDLLTGRVRVPDAGTVAVASADGASSNQPGATPQVSERHSGKGWKPDP